MEKEYIVKEEHGKKIVEWEENISNTVKRSATEEEINNTIEIIQKQIENSTMELEKLNDRLSEFTNLKSKIT
jgi:23S rRNA A2030 N6-methylase RlmJ